MLAVGIGLWVLGYALAYTGATKIARSGAAPGLLYNLGISNDPSSGPAGDNSLGGILGRAAGAAAGGITPVGPAMPSPTAGATPVQVV